MRLLRLLAGAGRQPAAVAVSERPSPRRAGIGRHSHTSVARCLREQRPFPKCNIACAVFVALGLPLHLRLCHKFFALNFPELSHQPALAIHAGHAAGGCGSRGSVGKAQPMQGRHWQAFPHKRGQMFERTKAFSHMQHSMCCVCSPGFALALALVSQVLCPELP